MKSFHETTETQSVFHLNFSIFDKASPEAMGRILLALNVEMAEALQEKRIPLLDKAFERLGNFPKTMM